MNSTTSKNALARFACAYLWTLALALYFAKAIGGTPPAYYAVLALAGMGLILNFVFILLAGKGPVHATQAWLLFALFTILQGTLGVLIEQYGFRWGWLPSLDYSAGAVVGLWVFWAQRAAIPRLLASLLGLSFLAVGVAIALRLGGVLGGLLFTLAILNGFWLARKLSTSQAEAALPVERLVLATVLLATGRAVIQYYLLESNYANLGVVITHPYT
ncbi:MAG: hypothetical protein ACREP8_07555, partial [Candidatus Binatia bacterium]